ncbi:MAG: glycosyltransferase family 2 protein [Candidatus Cloacimonetes bacterium]|nr:glycosyltransferase family 2 protein [Candidatus Cloacimonadota bacterium]
MNRTAQDESGSPVRLMACVPAYNNPFDLERLLDSIVDSTRKVDLVFIVDNSEDGYLERNQTLVARYPDNFVYYPNRKPLKGCAQAFRIGMEKFLELDYDLLLLLDQDGLISPDSIEKYIEHRHEADLLVPQIRNIDPNSPKKLGLLPSKVTGFAKTYTTEAEPGESVIGPNMGLLINRKVVEHCVYDDENYLVWFSDFDYGLKTRSLGYQSRYMPDIVVYHPNLSEKYPSRSGKLSTLRFRLTPFQHLGYVSQGSTEQETFAVYSRVYMSAKYFHPLVVYANLLYTLNPILLWYRIFRYRVLWRETLSVYRRAIHAGRRDRRSPAKRSGNFG